MPTALITGASSGLGAEFARQLAARGCDLVLVARREEKLRELANELAKERGVSVHICAADLSQRPAPAAIEEFVRERGLAIDWLVNNAGVAGPELLAEKDWDAQCAFFELMMISVASLCHRFVPPMVERGRGWVVNVASVAGRIARPAGANYGPSKAYVIALSEELELSLRGTGVHVSALCPGFVHTEFHETAGLGEMKAKSSNLLWYDAETVVREGIEGVLRGEPIVVSGRLYRWLDPFAQSVVTRPLVKRLVPGR